MARPGLSELSKVGFACRVTGMAPAAPGPPGPPGPPAPGSGKALGGKVHTLSRF